MPMLSSCIAVTLPQNPLGRLDNDLPAPLGLVQFSQLFVYADEVAQARQGLGVFAAECVSGRPDDPFS